MKLTITTDDDLLTELNNFPVGTTFTDLSQDTLTWDGTYLMSYLSEEFRSITNYDTSDFPLQARTIPIHLDTLASQVQSLPVGTILDTANGRLAYTPAGLTSPDRPVQYTFLSSLDDKDFPITAHVPVYPHLRSHNA